MSVLQSQTDIQECPNANVLQAFSLGKLTQFEISTIAEHLDICNDCMHSLENLDLLKDEMISNLQEQPRAKGVSLENDSAVKNQLESISAWASSIAPNCYADIPKEIGPYEILKPLGEGGMGKVFKVRHKHLGKIMALKLLPPASIRNSDAIDRFVREMKTVGRLDHPNIVQAYDAEVDGIPYLAMECIEGLDLARLVKLRQAISVADACACIRQIASALAYVNRYGLVHRDIKPSNVMLTPEGDVKLLDMGLARLHDEVAESAKVVGDEAKRPKVLGTIHYMAPEQLLNSQNVDIRADLYSLGCTLFHLLAGRPPFLLDTENPKAVTHGHLMQTAPDLREFRDDVPDGLVDVMNRLLAKDPADRFQKPEQLAKALAPFSVGCYLPGLIGDKRPTQAAESAHEALAPMPPFRQKPKVGWTAVALVTMLLAAVAFLALSIMRPVEPPLIRSVELQHQTFELDGVPTANRIITNDATPVVVTEDGLRFNIQLDKPAHCFLIGIGPDGKFFLCHPQDATNAPPATTELAFPANGAYRLSKGTGSYSFYLLVSLKQLPDFDTWKKANGFGNSQPMKVKRIWKYKEQRYVMISTDEAQMDAPAPASFKSLCNYFRSCSGVDSLYAVVIPVLDRSALEKSMPTP